MNQASATLGAVAMQPVAATKQDTGLPELLLALGATSIVLGLIWDISWHISIGRDTFWTPAHMAIYAGGVLGGCVGGWLAFQHTFLVPISSASSVRVFGLRAPLGAWVAIWGALAMVTSAPFDDWWHNAYGLDVKIVSPPHAVLGLGMFGISIGAVLLAAARQNRACASEHDRNTCTDAPTLHAPDAPHALPSLHAPHAQTLFIYAGGIFVLIGVVFLTEYTFPNMQHAAFFYYACSVMIPFRLVALSRAGRTTWPATRIAAVYMIFVCLMLWILPLFPAQPKLAPIYTRVTHMVPPAFPLLLVFPAAAIDLVLRGVGAPNSISARWIPMAGSRRNGIRRSVEVIPEPLRQMALAVALGAIFLLVFMAVQWFFAEFMLSSYAKNWFFAGDRSFGYGAGAGDWRTRFWHQDASRPGADLLSFSKVLFSWALAAVASWVGLIWGGWMRKVQR
ncbi:MAG: hypothetical protein C5B50_28685 [Verrucomicrobia bacterium]|nr:MAG: hypothetical protein C5B50_28685 [Verrucomicrobiota bacterium]